MTAELRRARALALTARQAAALQTVKNFANATGITIAVRDWSISVADEYEAQWCVEADARHPESAYWDWREIARRYHAPKEHVASFWYEARLFALALVTATRVAVTVDFLEGDPRPDCPLRGRRAAAALEYATLYGQRLGCDEIHVYAVNPDLEAILRGIWV